MDNIEERTDFLLIYIDEMSIKMLSLRYTNIKLNYIVE